MRNASTGARRAKAAAIVALALIVLAQPPESLRAALAAAAGSLFEATPFVLAGALLRGNALIRIAPLLACGCGSRLPAALSLPALAFAWISFGPAVAIARTLAALGVALSMAALDRRRTQIDGRLPAPQRGCPPQKSRDSSRTLGCGQPPVGTNGASRALEDLGAIGLAAFLAALALPLLGTARRTLGPAVAGLAGAAAGLLAPCGTAGLAAASALWVSNQPAAIGLLATAGIFAPRRLIRRGSDPNSETRKGSGGAVLGAIALACLWLWAIGGRGFLNPRLLALAPAGATIAAAAAFGAGIRCKRSSALVPAVLIAALAFGSPPPSAGVAALPLGLYPGARLDFVGQMRERGRTIERAAILCCRADARLLRLRLARRAHFSEGTWLEAAGTIVRSGDELELDARVVRRIAAPNDPFAYF